MSKRKAAPRIATLDRALREYVRDRDKTCHYWRGLEASEYIDRHLRCEGPLEVAHLIPRRHRMTRLDPANCVLLCQKHHKLLDYFPLDKDFWIRTALGETKWEELREKGRQFHKSTNADKWEELRNLQAMRKAL